MFSVREHGTSTPQNACTVRVLYWRILYANMERVVGRVGAHLQQLVAHGVDGEELALLADAQVFGEVGGGLVLLRHVAAEFAALLVVHLALVPHLSKRVTDGGLRA